MVCIYLAGLACTAVYTQLMAHVTQGFLHKLRTRMFAGMQKLPIRYFDQNSRGDIMSYYTNDIDTLRQLVSQSLPQLFAAGLTVIGLLLFMFYFSIPLMLIVFLGIFCMTKVKERRRQIGQILPQPAEVPRQGRRLYRRDDERPEGRQGLLP